MSRAVMISIQPKWCELIVNGKKTIEVRKTKPKHETPFKCYIYCTNGGRPLVYGDVPCANGWRETYTQTYGYGRKNAEEIWEVMNGKVIGEFVCDEIRTEWEVADGLVDIVLEMQSCVDCKDLIEYADGKKLYSWHISDLVIYDKPKELSEFYTSKRKHKSCRDCEHKGWKEMYSSNCDCEMCFEKAPITKPPQSWCYVEEVQA